MFTSSVVLSLLLLLGRAQDVALVEESSLRRSLQQDKALCDKVVDLMDFSQEQEFLFTNIDQGNDYTTECERRMVEDNDFNLGGQEQIFKVAVPRGQKVVFDVRSDEAMSYREISFGSNCLNRKFLDCAPGIHEETRSTLEYVNWEKQTMFAFLVYDADHIGDEEEFFIKYKISKASKCDKITDLTQINGNQRVFNTHDSGDALVASCRDSRRGGNRNANEEFFKHLLKPGEKIIIEPATPDFGATHELMVGKDCENTRRIICTTDENTELQFTNQESEDIWAFLIVEGNSAGSKGKVDLKWQIIPPPPAICSATTLFGERKDAMFEIKDIGKPSCGSPPDFERKGKSVQIQLNPGATLRIRSNEAFNSIDQLSVGGNCNNVKLVECKENSERDVMYFTNEENKAMIAFFTTTAIDSKSDQVIIQWDTKTGKAEQYIRKNRVNLDGEDIRCGFKNEVALRGACTVDPRCVGYTMLLNGTPGCMKGNGSFKSDSKVRVLFEKKDKSGLQNAEASVGIGEDSVHSSSVGIEEEESLFRKYIFCLPIVFGIFIAVAYNCGTKRDSASDTLNKYFVATNL